MNYKIKYKQKMKYININVMEKNKIWNKSQKEKVKIYM